MTHTPHHRRSIRLRGYDYSRAGAYFITICTQGRACLFGDIVDGEMVLNDAGRVAWRCWHEVPDHFPHAELDEFVVMPNHIHGIIVIGTDDGAKGFSPLQSSVQSAARSCQQPAGTSKTIGSMVRGFKIGLTKWMRKNTTIHDVWQRNYYEHIVRNETELERIRQYIVENPAKWALDRNYRCGDSLSICTGEKPSAPMKKETWMI